MFIQLIAGKIIEEQIEELKKEIEKKKKIISEMKGENNNFLKNHHKLPYIHLNLIQKWSDTNHLKYHFYILQNNLQV